MVCYWISTTLFTIKTLFALLEWVGKSAYITRYFVPPNFHESLFCLILERQLLSWVFFGGGGLKWEPFLMRSNTFIFVQPLLSEWINVQRTIFCCENDLCIYYIFIVKHRFTQCAQLGYLLSNIDLHSALNEDKRGQASYLSVGESVCRSLYSFWSD